MFNKAALFLLFALSFCMGGCGNGNGILITPNPAVMGVTGSNAAAAGVTNADALPVQFQATITALDGTLQVVTDSVVWSVTDPKLVNITTGGLVTLRQGVNLACGFTTTVSATQGIASGSAILRLGC